VNGSLQVTPASLTITGATTLASVYTGNAQTNTYTTSSLYGSDSVTGVSGLASRTHVGTSSDSLSAATGSGLSNYDISYVNGSLQVTPASLTVTANDQSRLYGGANPTFTEIISGFVNGENSSVVSGTATGYTTATSTTGVGTATITASNTGLSAANYNFNNLVDGVLTINAVPHASESVSAQVVASITAPPVATQPTSSTQPAALKVSYSSSADASQSSTASSGINIMDAGVKLPSSGNTTTVDSGVKLNSSGNDTNGSGIKSNNSDKAKKI